MALALPETIDDVEQLEDLLSRPTDAAVATMSRLEGDLIILGAGGKMGPTLARMACRATAEAGVERTVYAVSRFTDESAAQSLRDAGLEVVRGDLLDPSFVESLPEVPNVVFMAGMKFGAGAAAPQTWAMNTFVPALVAQRFAGSRIASFSTGNVYALTSPESGGSVETDPPAPIGEYAMSVLGRERMFAYFCRTQQTPTALLRLNYACELRYGVLVDLCRKVHAGEEIDLSMGHVNVIWQGDANAMTLCALGDCAVPETVLNIAGPEILSVRDVCNQFGELLGTTPRFSGVEAPDALLNNGALAREKYGAPRVSAAVLIRWIADWVKRGGASLDKPTHFETRDGKF